MNKLENIVHKAKTLTFQRRKKEIIKAKQLYMDNRLNTDLVKSILHFYVSVTNGLNFNFQLTEPQEVKAMNILYNEIFEYDKTL